MRTLTYHDIAPHDRQEEVGFEGPLAARYKLEPGRFEEHLDALQETGLQVGTVRDGERLPQVALSFDDGGGSAPLIAAALERRGWRGHFFITTGRLGAPGFCSTEDVRALAGAGHVIGGHSHTHPTYMGKLARSDLDREWRQSREQLASVLGEPPRCAAVPGGYLTRAVVASAAEAGYELLFTSEPTSRVAHREVPVRGRYTIWSTTPARIAAAYAQGSPLACGRLWLEWNAKKLAKSVSPDAYQSLRRVRARL